MSLVLLPNAELARGQTTLTLQEAIEYAQANGPAAQTAQLAWRTARSEDEAFDAQYLPSVQLTGSAPGLERSINEITQDDGSVAYVPQSRLSSNTRLAINQLIPWTNTRVFVSTRLARLDVFGDRSFSRWNAAPISVGLSQPLFQYNAASWNRRLQPLRYEVSRHQHRADRAQVAEEVAAHFFDAYIARMEREHAAFKVAVNDTIYTLSKRRYEIGTIAENELLQSEQQLLEARAALEQARLEAERASQELKQVLGMNPETALTLDPPSAVPDLHVDPKQAVAQARQHHPTFTRQDLRVMQAKSELARAEGRSGLSVNIEASYGLNQQDETLGAAYRHPLNQQRFGIDFTVPLFQWDAGEAQVEAAQAELEQTRVEAERSRKELMQQVHFEARQLNQLQRQVTIAARADTLATRRFAVARSRYRIGEIAITDLFDAQQANDQARKRYYERLRQFWTTYYRLRRLTLYNFTLDQPLSP